jgi:integrase
VSIEKLPSGKFRGVVKVKGRRATTKAVSTRNEAVALEAQLTLEMGSEPDPSGVTMAELFAGQLDQSGYSATTHADLKSIIQRLPESFLAREVGKVTPAVLDGLYRQLTADGWSPHRIRRVHSTVGSAFRKRAIPFRWANSNPARDVQPPAIPHHEVAPPSNSEVIALINGAPDSFRAFVRLSANSGMRRSEVLALQWGDVDLDTGRIVVRRSITHTPASGIVIGLTKTGTKGHRVITVGPSVVAELTAHRADQETAAKSHQMPAPVWVFSHEVGASPWRPDYVTLKFNRLRKDLGLTHVRLHDLRHWAATSLLSEGTPVATVSKRLGHGRTSTTLDKYAHWMPAQDQDAANSLDALLS